MPHLSPTFWLLIFLSFPILFFLWFCTKSPSIKKW